RRAACEPRLVACCRCVVSPVRWAVPCPGRRAPFSFSARAATEIYTLSLHDALPILFLSVWVFAGASQFLVVGLVAAGVAWQRPRSEEHTSELQSRENLVCRLLLEKKKGTTAPRPHRRRGSRSDSLRGAEARYTGASF